MAGVVAKIKSLFSLGIFQVFCYCLSVFFGLLVTIPVGVTLVSTATCFMVCILTETTLNYVDLKSSAFDLIWSAHLYTGVHCLNCVVSPCIVYVIFCTYHYTFGGFNIKRVWLVKFTCT